MKAEPRRPDESPAPPDALSSKTLNATVYRETAAVCLRCVSGMAADTSATTVDTCALVSLCTYHTQSFTVRVKRRDTYERHTRVDKGERADTNVLLCRGVACA